MHEAGHDGGARPDHAAPEQRPARPEAVTDPAADHLEQQIRIGEGRKHQAELRIGETQFLLDAAGRGADVHPVDVGDEVHDAQHRQHDMGGLETKPHFLLPDSLFLWFWSDCCGDPSPVAQLEVALSCAGVLDPLRSSSNVIAAATPPARCGTPASDNPISTPVSAPNSVSSLHSPRWPMRNTLPASLLKPEPSDML